MATLPNRTPKEVVVAKCEFITAYPHGVYSAPPAHHSTSSETLNATLHLSPGLPSAYQSRSVFLSLSQPTDVMNKDDESELAASRPFIEDISIQYHSCFADTILLYSVHLVMTY